jgi:peptidylprolyl isomerase
MSKHSAIKGVGMHRIKEGDRVKVHYTEKLENGRVLDTSKGDLPLEIKVGNNIVPLFEQAIKGMKTGDTKKIKVPPAKAYGPRLEERILEVPKNSLPENISPMIGCKVELKKQSGDTIDARITSIKENTVTLDANHPLAGIPIVFEIQIVEIR